jgi:pimeloyl-ACP methyl ester carboxylesterase
MRIFILLVCLITGLLAGMILLIGLPGFQKPRIDDRYQGEVIEMKGDTIRFFQKGKGPDILLIHGIPGMAEDWEELVNELAASYRVTMYDRPGHGFSSFQYHASPLVYNMEIAAGLKSALSLDDVIVVGHSYGSTVALALAVHDTPGIKGYVLLSAASFPAGGYKLYHRIVGFPVAGRGLIRIIRGSILPPAMEAKLNSYFNPNREMMPEDYYTTRIHFFIQVKSLVSSSREEAFFNRDITAIEQDYGNITKPVLLVHGENDKVIPLSLARDLDSTLPDSRMVVLKETGHMVQYVMPVKIKNEIDSFFK